LQQLEREVALRQSLVQAERANYELGRSRLRALIESQDRLADSQLRLLDGQVRTQVAEVSLRALSGELFASLGVQVKQAPALQ